MKISALLNGPVVSGGCVVTIGNVIVDGNTAYIIYTDDSNALFMTKRFIPSGAGAITTSGSYIPVQLCTSAVIVS